MKVFSTVFAIVLTCTVIAGCNSHTTEPTESAMPVTDTTQAELKKIDSLLQDKNFVEAMAMELEAAYYKGIGEKVPVFLKPGEDSLQVEKNIQEEKIATNVAGFYALECGINYLCSRDSSTPAEWVDKLISKKATPEEVEIVNRFANATWKASQPFRGLDRIKKDNFMAWSGLSNAEVQKDYRQIVGAATKIKPLLKGTQAEQLLQLKTLLQSKGFAVEMAAFMDSSYYAGENKPMLPFSSKEDVTTTKKKSFKEEKIATNIAGFYATECGVNYFVASQNKQPSFILQSIVDGNIAKEDKLLFCRFANATWKTGQPFRGLERIKRETFTPFNFLNEAEVEKDWVQIKAAAAKLLQELKK